MLLAVVVLTCGVRILTLQFMREHLNDAGWFQFGSYAIFDRQARDILDGRQRVFFIADPSRTDLVQYPPAYPALVAIIYKLTGNYSSYGVQTVQWFADLLLSLLLIMGVAISAFNWRVGIVTGFLVGLSPLLAMYAAYPSADIPTMWFVLGANWLLVLALKRNSLKMCLGAGVLLGLACWLRVNPLYLCVFWAFAVLIFAKLSMKRRLSMSSAILFSTFVVISPIVVRNYFTFPDFTPTGGTIGTNLWEGLGETELGRNNGFATSDDKMVQAERVKSGLPDNLPVTLQWPDGIRRDRNRAREAITFIAHHPIWYAGVMLKRMWGMLKVAGGPLPYYGSNGINVTSKKCLPPDWQGGLIAYGVKVLGMIQSVTRYLLLPAAAFGLFIAARRDLAITGVLAMTILYYLGPGTAAHTEIRYVLPMHAILIVFAGVGVVRLSVPRSRQKANASSEVST